MLNPSVDVLMQPIVCKLPHTATLQEALTMMAECRHACVVVMDEEHPIGLVTERDVVRWFANPRGNHTGVQLSRVMSSPPVKVALTATVVDVLLLTRARNLRQALVMDENDTLVGIVSQADLVAEYIHLVGNYQSELRRDVEKHTAELEQENRELLNLAMEDELTKVGNRRAMELDLNHTQASAERFAESYQLALVDIDFFKAYNDHYGHQAGDECLQRVANLLRDQVRETDRIYRYGGEEFLLLMPKLTLEQAEQVTQRACDAILNANIPHEDSPFGVLTVSAGVASGANGEWEDAVAHADSAMYRAKEEGRNKVVKWET